MPSSVTLKANKICFAWFAFLQNLLCMVCIFAKSAWITIWQIGRQYTDYFDFDIFPQLAVMLRVNPVVNVDWVKTEGTSQNIAQILATPTKNQDPTTVGDKQKSKHRHRRNVTF